MDKVTLAIQDGQHGTASTSEYVPTPCYVPCACLCHCPNKLSSMRAGLPQDVVSTQITRTPIYLNLQFIATTLHLCVFQQGPVLMLVSVSERLACTDRASRLMADAVLVAAGFWKLQVCQMQCCGRFPGGPQILQHGITGLYRLLYSVPRCRP